MSINKEIDEKWMSLALELAEHGRGYTNPNPVVGAVIVKDGQVLGQGWHRYHGGLHAERNAIKDCLERGNTPEGATIYVTLEPCCHYGKTPPCTEAIMEHRLARVVFGSWDPNPKVAGQGIRILREAGLEVDGPVMERECLAINKVFMSFIMHNRPYVISKYAMTADGKIASVTGDSKWISGPESRAEVHRCRKALAAIMVGIGTVLADDPMLNCRLPEPEDLSQEAVAALPEGERRQYLAEQLQLKEVREQGRRPDPIRIVCDSHLRLPVESQLVQTAREIRTIAVCLEGQAARRAELEAAGVEVLEVPDRGGRVDVEALMDRLGEMKIDSVLIEGGGELHFSALEAGVVNEIHAYIAPKIIGGKDAPSPVGGAGIPVMADAIELSKPDVEIIGDDILLKYRVRPPVRVVW